jgi:hypothetical protein
MILPRQARDKHRENSKKKSVSSPGREDVQLGGCDAGGFVLNSLCGNETQRFAKTRSGQNEPQLKILKGVASRRWDSGERVCERRLSAGGSAGDKVRRPRDWLVRQNRLFSRCQSILKNPDIYQDRLGTNVG